MSFYGDTWFTSDSGALKKLEEIAALPWSKREEALDRLSRERIFAHPKFQKGMRGGLLGTLLTVSLLRQTQSAEFHFKAHLKVPKLLDDRKKLLSYTNQISKDPKAFFDLIELMRRDLSFDTSIKDELLERFWFVLSLKQSHILSQAEYRQFLYDVGSLFSDPSRVTIKGGRPGGPIGFEDEKNPAPAVNIVRHDPDLPSPQALFGEERRLEPMASVEVSKDRYLAMLHVLLWESDNFPFLADLIETMFTRLIQSDPQWLQKEVPRALARWRYPQLIAILSHTSLQHPHVSLSKMGELDFETIQKTLNKPDKVPPWLMDELYKDWTQERAEKEARAKKGKR